jgi:hypothetical protein
MKNYERPYTYEELVKHYGKYIANKLSNDPCHKWRMETGIELIHKEPDLDEQKRIWENWQLMSGEDKQKSDEKCIELFGMTNEKLNSYIFKNCWNNQECNKFNLVYENIMKKTLNKNDPNKLCHFSFPLLKTSNFPFLNKLMFLINEDYHIFPVPKELLDDIEQFVKTCYYKRSDSFFEKRYYLNDIKKMVKNWKYYNEFEVNLNEMLNKNIKSNIICCVFNNINDIKNIISKYKLDVDINEIFDSFASIFTCGDSIDFNACLCIKNNSNYFKIRKAIQHELIHWMQISLNKHTKKSYGLFNNINFNLSDDYLEEFSKLMKMTNNGFKHTFEYLLNGREFEAWVANTCEEFEDSELTIDEFKDIIENFDKFKYVFKLSDNDKQEMYLFGEICYLSSLSGDDNRYWYLIEALKENKND